MPNGSAEFPRRTTVRSFGLAVLDTLYPRQCWACGSPLPPERVVAESAPSGRFFCPRCVAEFPRIQPPYCDRCGEPYDLETEGPFRCWNCTGRRMGFEFAVSAYHASGAVRDMIHRFKYGREFTRRASLGVLLLDALRDPRLASERLEEWFVVPVPLHRSREMEREFNQSWELSQEVARHLGATACQALDRLQPTRSQASLDRRQRLRNLRGVFALRRATWWRRIPDLSGKHVLLVDDVLTTGATCHECARILKREGGVEKVVVITVARG